MGIGAAVGAVAAPDLAVDDGGTNGLLTQVVRRRQELVSRAVARRSLPWQQEREYLRHMPFEELGEGLVGRVAFDRSDEFRQLVGQPRPPPRQSRQAEFTRDESVAYLQTAAQQAMSLMGGPGTVRKCPENPIA